MLLDYQDVLVLMVVSVLLSIVIGLLWSLCKKEMLIQTIVTTLTIIVIIAFVILVSHIILLSFVCMKGN